MTSAIRRQAAWAAIGAAGAVVAVGSLLPGVRIAVSAFVGVGEAQRSFRYEADDALALDLRPLGLIPLAAGLLLAAAAVVAIVRGPRAWLALGAFAVSLVLGWLVLATSERLGWEGHAVAAHGGFHGLLQPGLHEVEAAARSSPEARRPGWTLVGGENFYAARGLIGWTLIRVGTLALLWLTAYRVARLRLRPWACVWLVTAATAAVFVWLVLRGLSRYD